MCRVTCFPVDCYIVEKHFLILLSIYVLDCMLYFQLDVYHAFNLFEICDPYGILLKFNFPCAELLLYSSIRYTL